MYLNVFTTIGWRDNAFTAAVIKKPDNSGHFIRQTNSLLLRNIFSIPISLRIASVITKASGWLKKILPKYSPHALMRHRFEVQNLTSFF
ncbi:hypothetical protein GBFDFA_06745 [Edwardsiella anguillarum]|nr:hypothetical protein QY76_13380 [Edwardsiella sp. EA181011]BET80534.1 hypothetical protein PBOPBF_06745 [Edwardsiella anguillarum]BET83823.1 hypothetical protein GHNJMD_07055 [Edwardsiella anguillarum]BET87190.1 hypothetical protein GBFDFA_06745 [Edwardsiella anguillarum]BET90616.1 hypothetical protein BIKEJJ_06750 [Edwardsiella anguillarum]